MTNTYWFEYDSTVDLWLVLEFNCKGSRIVATAATPEAAAAEMDLIEAIDGACKVAQNGMTSAADVADYVPNYTTNH